MRRKLGWLAAAAVLAALVLSRKAPRRSLPEALLTLRSPNPQLLADYKELMPDQAAIFLAEESQEALPAARTLSPVGVPFFITRDFAAALRHRLVFIPCNDHAIRFTEEQRTRLREFVSAGGLLILQPLAGSPWPELTGARRFKASLSRKRLAFKRGADRGFAYLNEPEELEIRLASSETKEGIWTSAVLPKRGAGATVLATYPDTGEPALLRRQLGKGFVYTLGVDLRDVVVRPQAGRSFDAQRIPFNGFEPAADVFSLIFRGWYEGYTPNWLRLRAAPGQARAMFLVSHNIGADTQLRMVDDFLDIEKRRGVKATYFTQAKQALDEVKAPFFDGSLIARVKHLAQEGHEIASAGVAAGPDLESYPMGTGAEKTWEYRPKVGAYGKTKNGTLLGELRVSKSLLEAQLGGEKVLGFRSRLFAFPDWIDTGLLRAGYTYDSSLRAASVMTHFPFKLLRNQVMTRESEILEFPMTYQDAGKDEGVAFQGSILATLGKVADNEGVFVWLLSPTAEPVKKALLRSVLDARPAGLWTGTIGEAARFWRARAQTRWFKRGAGRQVTLHLDLPTNQPAVLSFEASGKISCHGTGVRCSGRLLMVENPGPARQIAVDLEIDN